VPAPELSGSSNRASIGEVGQGAKRRLLQIRNSLAERGAADSTYEVRTPVRSGPTLKTCSGIQFQAHDPGEYACFAKHI
ncbi:hypothetical protein PpBr36_07411, partial [Pyricularia pennisetigena]|uniref:hypothetical protein n=1 Tax=Pyricularia pennisetigena TaxID=1578925 RepID=UPI0011515890